MGYKIPCINYDGYKSKSNHQDGMAFDYFQNIKGHEWDKSFYDKAAKIGKSLGFEIGHYWTKFVDSPHCNVPTSWREPIEIKTDEDLQRAIAKIIS